MRPLSANSSPNSSPPPLDDAEPPSFQAARFDRLLQSDADDEILESLGFSVKKFDFPDMRIPGSPSSSVGVEADVDDLGTASPNSSLEPLTQSRSSIRRVTPSYSDYLNDDSNANSPDSLDSSIEISTHGATIASTDSGANVDPEGNIDTEEFDSRTVSDIVRFQRAALDSYVAVKGSEKDIDIDAHLSALEDHLRSQGLDPSQIAAAIESVDFERLYTNDEFELYAQRKSDNMKVDALFLEPSK